MATTDTPQDITTAVNYVLDDEGAEINESPDEPGGISKYGVSLEAYAEDCRARRAAAPTMDTIRNMMRSDAFAFYARKADTVRFSDLPTGVDYIALDHAVTLGNTGAALLMQMCLDIWPTSMAFDDATIAKVKLADTPTLIKMNCAAWLAWKSRLSPTGWSKYGHGWTNRSVAKQQRAMLMFLGKSAPGS